MQLRRKQRKTLRVEIGSQWTCVSEISCRRCYTDHLKSHKAAVIKQNRTRHRKQILLMKATKLSDIGDQKGLT